MKQRIVFFLILVLVMIGLAVYGYFGAVPGVDNQTENRPQIEIMPQSFDFGEIEYGEIAKHTFLVKNSGSQILEIKKVATSCACTKAEVGQKEIKPGETVELQVTYDTGAMSGPHGRGEQERIIYIKSNDPISPQTEVTITAYVK